MKVKKSYKLNTIVFALILIIVSAVLLYITYIIYRIQLLLKYVNQLLIL